MKTALKLILGKGVRKSYGQFGEDAVIQAILKNTKGTYVDVGAYDPVLYSNTFALYQRGWSGYVIDPNVSKKDAFDFYRPRDTFIWAGVGEADVRRYYQFEDPAYNSFERPEGSISSTLVPIRPLEDFMSADVQFLNIDVEGMDLDVLKSYSWTHRPKLIAIEASINSPCQSFLEAQGYKLAGLAGKTLLLTYDQRLH